MDAQRFERLARRLIEDTEFRAFLIYYEGLTADQWKSSYEPHRREELWQKVQAIREIMSEMEAIALETS
jgi:hypothetical protein